MINFSITLIFFFAGSESIEFFCSSRANTILLILADENFEEHSKHFQTLASSLDITGPFNNIEHRIIYFINIK